MTDNKINNRIDIGDFTLYDKFMYGGIGYGYICLPKNLIRVLLSIAFPPFAIILKHLNPSDQAPYITWDNILNLVNNLHDIMFTLLLTFLFWIPGVIYAFNSLKVFGAEVKEEEEKFKDTYGFSPDELDEKTVKEFMLNLKKKKKYNL